MDNFMDKAPVRKISPQDMIRANAQAEAQENERLRLQKEQYRKEVAALKKSTEQTQSTLQSIEELLMKRPKGNDNEEVLDALKELGEKIGKRVEESDQATHETGVRVYRNVEAKLDESLKIQTGELTELIKEGNTDELSERIKLSTEVITTQIKEMQDALMASMDENGVRQIEELETKNQELGVALEETKAAASQSERVLRPIVLITLILSIVNLAVNLLRVFGIL